MAMRWLAAACVLAAACGGESWAPSKTKAHDAAAAAPVVAVAPAIDAPVVDTAVVTGPRDPLFGQIPHDTPYLFIQREQGVFGKTPTDALLELRGSVKPWFGLFVPDDSQITPSGRLAVAAARLFLDLDEATLRKIGFGDPARTMVMYGLGLVPVVRLEVDGALLRERFMAEAARAGAAQPFADWHGRPYVQWSLGDGGAALVVMFRDDQLAIAIARNAADVLPHLAGEAPAPVPLDEAALLRAGGVSGTLTMWIDPARAAALVGGTGAGALPALVDAPAGCGAALAPVIAGLPPIAAAATASGDRVAVTMRVGPVPMFAETLRGVAHPIAHWPTAPPPRDTAYYGLGMGVLPILTTVAGFADRMGAASAACGGEPPGPSKALLVTLAGAPLAALEGFSAIQDVRRNADVPRIVFLAEVSDPERIYKLAADKLGLSPRPPPLDKARTFRKDGVRGSLTLHRDAISGWMGRGNAKAAALLRTAPPGDAAIFRFASATYDARIGLDGDHLLVEYSAPR
jgi:hypothetical protein